MCLTGSRFALEYLVLWDGVDCFSADWVQFASVHRREVEEVPKQTQCMWLPGEPSGLSLLKLNPGRTLLIRCFYSQMSARQRGIYKGPERPDVFTAAALRMAALWEQPESPLLE